MELSEIIPWFSSDAFQAGFLVTLFWWVQGLFVGWLFDLVRKS